MEKNFELLTVEEVMTRLKVGRNTLYKLINTEQLVAVKVMGKWRIPVSSLEDFIDRAYPVKVVREEK